MNRRLPAEQLRTLDDSGQSESSPRVVFPRLEYEAVAVIMHDQL
jgi:hypothetical protein